MWQNDSLWLVDKEKEEGRRAEEVRTKSLRNELLEQAIQDLERECKDIEEECRSLEGLEAGLTGLAQRETHSTVNAKENQGSANSDRLGVLSSQEQLLMSEIAQLEQLDAQKKSELVRAKEENVQVSSEGDAVSAGKSGQTVSAGQ